jgi:hypothetical protein
MIWSLPHVLALSLVWTPAPPPRPEHPRIREVLKELQRLRDTYPNYDQSVNYHGLLRELERLRQYQREHRTEGPQEPGPQVQPLKPLERQRILEKRLQRLQNRRRGVALEREYQRVLQELNKLKRRK